MCDTLFNQNYLFKSDKMEKVVLAFSGGLDTTVCVKLLEEEYSCKTFNCTENHRNS